MVCFVLGGLTILSGRWSRSRTVQRKLNWEAVRELVATPASRTS